MEVNLSIKRMRLETNERTLVGMWQVYTLYWLRPLLGGYHPLLDIGAATGIEFILKFSCGHGTSIGSF